MTWFGRLFARRPPARRPKRAATARAITLAPESLEGRLLQSQGIEALPRPLGRAPLVGYIAPTANGNAFAIVNRTRGDITLESVTPAGQISKFPVPRNVISANAAITGPDGNFWFAATGLPAGLIAQVSPNGQITEFSITGSDGNPAQPVSVVNGPRNLLWFADAGTNAIGWLATNGAVVKFPIPGGLAARPQSIAAGSDGNLWFTLPKLNEIGRMTPTGAFRFFSLGSVSPRSITAAPNGTLAFSALSGTRPVAGEITTAGYVSYFTVPASGTEFAGTALGADGSVWYVAGNNIGRITSNGTVVEYPITAFVPGKRHNAVSITAAPSGNLYLVDTQTGQVIKVTPSLLPPVK